MNHIGLDWGTNYTSVGFSTSGNEKPEAAKFRDNGKEKMPSLVYYSEYDTLVGEQVQSHLEQISQYPPEDRLKLQQGIVRSLKRQLNSSGAHMVPGKGLVSHVDIVRDTFAYVKKDIEAGCFGDQAVDKVTLTHPVVCIEAYKELIKTAAFNAGFKDVKLLEEPIAAAMGYASRGADVGRGILVYDFGGGTFDVAFVLQDDDGNFRIPIPSMGDPMCGGDDLDMRLYKYWDQKARESLGRPITDKPGEIDAGFLFRCRYQKETLSRVSKMEFIEYLPRLAGDTDPGANRLSLVLDQSMLNQMFAKEINHTVDITRSMLKKIEDAGHKIDTVILIGGSSKWPLVKELLKEALPVAPLETMNVDVAVAMGAAVYGVPTKGTLEIETSPAGAMVYLDGESHGPSPVTLSDLSPGRVSVRAELAGYQPQSNGFDIETGRTIQAKLILEKVSEKGRLTVHVDPPEAQVNIPGSSTTYQPGMALSVGRYEIEVSKQGYETKTEWVHLAAGEHVQMDVKLAPGKGAEWRDPVTGMEFVWVPGGSYQMGCGEWDGEGDDEETPVHEVSVDGFWMGKYPVTQGQWVKVMGSNPSKFKKGDNYPVEEVSWDDAKEFIRKLMSMSNGEFQFRLPTDAEWEYACRSGGKPEKYAGGKDVGSVAWYYENSYMLVDMAGFMGLFIKKGKKYSTHPVGKKAPNGLGLYDMCGNVWEWCEDIFDSGAYRKHQRNNPIYTGGGSNRVIRGGGWCYSARGVRCARRSCSGPASRRDFVGFRLVRTP